MRDASGERARPSQAFVAVVTVLLAIPVIAIIAVAAWWSGIVRLPPSPLSLPGPAEVVDGPNCLADEAIAAVGGVPPGAGGLPDGGAVPPGFVPVLVVTCAAAPQMDSDRIVIVQAVVEGDLEPLLDALDGPFFPYDGPYECDAAEWDGRTLWLVDDSGRAILASWPSTPCGGQDGVVYAPVRLLDVVSRSEHLVDRAPRPAP